MSPPSSRGVVLARHDLELCAANLARDLLEQLEALGVLVGRVGVVGQIAGDDDQLGAIFQPVDSSDGAFERLGAERVGRSVESDVRVAQLNERERRGRLAVELGERARDPFGAGAARERGEYAVERADAEGSARDAQERSTIKFGFHQESPRADERFHRARLGGWRKFPRLRRKGSRE